MFFWVFLIVLGSSCQRQSEQKPNIIFILTDDQRRDALGYAGNPIIHTPNMDRLASSGLYFENAFVSTPICAASRATLFTGLYERTHNYTFGRPNLADGYMMESYPYLLRKNGYRTGFVGKFGVNVNTGITDSIFDSFVSTRYPYLMEENGEPRHLADIHGDEAIRFIESSGEEPFCLSLSFWSPHAEDNTYQQYFWAPYVDSLYRDVKIPDPANADTSFFNALPDFLQTSMNRKRWYWRFDSLQKRQNMVKGYYRMISTVDHVMGRITNKLDHLGLADNTIIILMGDNGYFLGERGYAGKWTMHELSIRVPLFIYDPRKSSGIRTVREMVMNVDVTPTILDLAGVSAPARYQGSSLVPFFDSAPVNWRTSVFTEHRLEGNDLLLRTDGYRDQQYKFIRYDDHDYLELYDLHSDPDESSNLAYSDQFSHLVGTYDMKCDSIIGKLLSDRLEEHNMRD